uniref:Uncharacterized protein n=1 Tax=Alexandrium andersonii TaxID=327968 RepID=A0A7S2MW17_9DINO
MNYLLLAWLMKRGATPLWTRANVIALDFPTPVLVHRIIEAMQEQQDCGYAITCKITGSCWASSLLDRDGSCKREEDVLRELELHAASKGIGIFLKVFFGLLAFTFVACTACCTFIVMKRRRAKPEEGKKEDSMATPLNNTAASTAAHQG